LERYYPHYQATVAVDELHFDPTAISDSDILDGEGSEGE
jgi:hypothetical protein